MFLILTVTHAIVVPKVGLILEPDIPIPPGFKPFTTKVAIKPPEQEPFEAEAEFNLTRFNPGGSVIQIRLKDTPETSVPVGSQVLMPESSRKLLGMGVAP